MSAEVIALANHADRTLAVQDRARELANQQFRTAAMRLFDRLGLHASGCAIMLMDIEQNLTKLEMQAWEEIL